MDGEAVDTMWFTTTRCVKLASAVDVCCVARSSLRSSGVIARNTGNTKFHTFSNIFPLNLLIIEACGQRTGSNKSGSRAEAVVKRYMLLLFIGGEFTSTMATGV